MPRREASAGTAGRDVPPRRGPRRACDRRTSATGSPGGRRTRSRLREPRRLASFEGGNEGRGTPGVVARIVGDRRQHAPSLGPPPRYSDQTMAVHTKHPVAAPPTAPIRATSGHLLLRGGASSSSPRPSPGPRGRWRSASPPPPSRSSSPGSSRRRCGRSRVPRCSGVDCRGSLSPMSCGRCARCCGRRISRRRPRRSSSCW
jgi:hypothetical protein